MFLFLSFRSCEFCDSRRVLLFHYEVCLSWSMVHISFVVGVAGEVEGLRCAKSSLH